MKQLLLISLMWITSINSLYAQDDKQVSSKNSAIITDMEFIIQSYESGLDVVMFANLAKTQGSSVTVQDYGKMIELHHNEVNKELQILADKNNITLPSQLPILVKNQYETMRIKTDSEFDKAYMEKMISDHQNLISLFENEIENGQNEEIRSWAQNNLANLKLHLKQAIEVNMEIK